MRSSCEKTYFTVVPKALFLLSSKHFAPFASVEVYIMRWRFSGAAIAISPCLPPVAFAFVSCIMEKKGVALIRRLFAVWGMPIVSPAWNWCLDLCLTGYWTYTFGIIPQNRSICGDRSALRISFCGCCWPFSVCGSAVLCEGFGGGYSQGRNQTNKGIFAKKENALCKKSPIKREIPSFFPKNE